MNNTNTVKKRFLASVYFLSIISLICSTLLFYLCLLGPLLVLIPWSLLFLIKRDSPYFKDWKNIQALLCIVYVYIIGATLGLLNIGALIGIADSIMISVVYLLLLLALIVHGTYVFYQSYKLT